MVTAASNPFTTYFAEILRGEGANDFATIGPLSGRRPTVLASYDVVVLGETPLTASQVTMFTTWVNGGGNLIAMRPDKQLAALLGLTDAAATLADAYLLVNTAAAPGRRHRESDDAVPRDGRPVHAERRHALATLYSNATTATANPAVTTAHGRQPGAQTALHLRPREVGRLHAPGQSRLVGTGARRTVATDHPVG